MAARDAMEHSHYSVVAHPQLHFERESMRGCACTYCRVLSFMDFMNAPRPAAKEQHTKTAAAGLHATGLRLIDCTLSHLPSSFTVFLGAS
jgi:hypothetical protein